MPIVERKKSPNRLMVDEAANEDNSVVALHPNTIERLQFFRRPPQGMPNLSDSPALVGPNPRAQVGNMDSGLRKSGGVPCGFDLSGEEFWPYLLLFLWPQMSTAGNCNGFYIFFLVLRVFPVLNHPCQLVKISSFTTSFFPEPKRSGNEI